MKLLRRVQIARGMSLILITHDLRLAFSTCDRIHVLYAGSLMEVGSVADVERDPFHPYTLGLLLSEPPADKRVKRLIAIRGTVPKAGDVDGICAFAPRCDWAQEQCRAGKPALSEQAPAPLQRLHPPRRDIQRDARAAPSRAGSSSTHRGERNTEGDPAGQRSGEDLCRPRRPAGARAQGRFHRGRRRRKRRAGGGIRLRQDHARALPGRAGELRPPAVSISTASPRRMSRRLPPSSAGAAQQDPDGLPGSLFHPQPQAQRAALSFGGTAGGR